MPVKLPTSCIAFLGGSTDVAGSGLMADSVPLAGQEAAHGRRVRQPAAG